MDAPAGEGSAWPALVTGGAGFIGSHLVDHLLASPAAQVVVLDDLSSGRLENLSRWADDPRFRFVRGDVRDGAAVNDAIRDAAVVYHLAGRRLEAPASVVADGTADDAAEQLFETNVRGTFNVLRAASERGVRRVVFASSHEVYGEPAGLPVDESHPLQAAGLYGATKSAGEALCRAFRLERGLQISVLRLASVYGERDTRQAIPGWLDRAAAGRDLEVHDAQRVTDFIWVGQTVEALVRAALLPEALPPVNVGSGTGVRLVDVARRIMHLTAGRSHVRVLSTDRRLAPPVRFVAKVDRMQHLLRIEPPLDPLIHLPALLSALAPALVLRGEHAGSHVSPVIVPV